MNHRILLLLLLIAAASLLGVAPLHADDDIAAKVLELFPLRQR